MGKALKRISYGFVTLVFLTGVSVGGHYVFEAASDNQTATGISAVMQYALTIATLLLVFFTLRLAAEARRQAEHAKESAEQSAHDSLLERVDARSPKIRVVYRGTSIELQKDGKPVEPVKKPHPKGHGLEVPSHYYISGDIPLDGYMLSVETHYAVKAFGDTPSFITVLVGHPHTQAEKGTGVVEPGGEGLPFLNHREVVNGEDIRSLVRKGPESKDAPGSLTSVTISVTDSTQSIEDQYTFEVQWWPFAESNGGIRIELRQPEGDGPSPIVPAQRIYHLDHARVEMG